MAGEVWRRDGDPQDWELSTLEGKKLSSFFLYFAFWKSCQCSFHHGFHFFVFLRVTVNFQLSNLVTNSVISPSIGIFFVILGNTIKTFQGFPLLLFQVSL